MPDHNLQSIASPESRVFLTSAGISTEPLKQAFLSQIHSAPLRGGSLKILRASDGWGRFAPHDHVGTGAKLSQDIEARAIRWWSDICLDYSFGRQNISVKSLPIADLASSDFYDRASKADILELPGGNTYLQARALARHSEAITALAESGKLAVEAFSAGSINLGSTIAAAAVEPADTMPYGGDTLPTLSLIDRPILVHASGREAAFSIPQHGRHLIGAAFRLFASNQSAQREFMARYPDTVSLTDDTALLIANGDGRLVGSTPRALPVLGMPVPQE